MKNWLQKSELKKVAGKLDKVSDIIPAPDVLNFFNKLMESYSEHLSTQRELAKIEAQKEIVLAEINRKYDLYHEVFDRLFNERRAAIEKSFELIDKGMQIGDKDLIGMGLQGLSKIVSSSPFSDIEKLGRLLEGKTIIEI